MAKKSNTDKYDRFTDPNSTFFSTFIGEFVEIITTASLTMENGTMPVVVQGILLDVDEENLYLSDDGIKIARAIRRNGYISIEVDKFKTEEEKMLEALDVPVNDDEVN